MVGYLGPQSLPVHAKLWSPQGVTAVSAHLEDREAPLSSKDGVLWTGEINIANLSHGTYELHVTATDTTGGKIASNVRITIGERPARSYAETDQENTIGEWRDRGLLGTQLGPNKNGKKW
jgi:hypothetical protein